MPRRTSITALAIGVAALSGCTAATATSGAPASDVGASIRPTATLAVGQRLVIATTVAPITSITSAVVGDLATVKGIVPEGTNSHTFEPRPSDAEVLSDADLVLVNGLGLEDPTMELAGKNRKDGAEIIELGARTITRAEWVFDFSFPEEEGEPNPHLWTNPRMVKRYAELVRDEVSRRDPAHAAVYATNTDAYLAKVDVLDAAMRTALASIPAHERELLTYHDAYAYFARDYGWTVVGAIQPSDFEEPTAKEVADLIEQVRSEDVRAIFGSEVFPSPVLEQIGRETGVRYVDVLRDDDLPGEPGGADHSLLELLRFDYRTIVEALGGDAAALIAADLTVATPDTAAYPR